MRVVQGAGLQKRIEVSESLVLSLGQDLQATQAQLHSLKAALEEEAGQLEVRPTACPAPPWTHLLL